MNVHFFKLLQDHYFIITLYYCHVTTHYFLIITVLLLDYCKGTFHYFIIITYLLLLHYVSITTILLPDYYRITTIDCFIIPWPILWLITTWLLQLLPLLPIFITTLIPITTIITIIHPPNLEMYVTPPSHGEPRKAVVSWRVRAAIHPRLAVLPASQPQSRPSPAQRWENNRNFPHNTQNDLLCDCAPQETERTSTRSSSQRSTGRRGGKD